MSFIDYNYVIFVIYGSNAMPTFNNTDIPTEITSMLQLYEDPAILLDKDYRIIAGNPAYCETYGTEKEALRNKHCYEVSHHYTVPCDQAGESCPLQASLESGETQRVLHLHHTPRGEEHVDVQTHPIRNDAGEIIYLVEVMRQTKIASALAVGTGLVGRSKAFNDMLELIHRAAPSDVTVLLQGESGTGKELVAQAIHDASQRNHAAFVPVECSGLTETLFESELFGHEKGAFTGAHNRKIGLVEAARGGTLFLDEIGDIPLSMQVKLLRLLETGTYRRVGSVESQDSDFRLICATHRDLKQMVQEGSFRQDLYYRISTFPIHLPALRERMSDLPLLVETLLHRMNQKIVVHANTLACLKAYSFPGNIRELRNVLERACLMADGDTILPQHLAPEMQCSPSFQQSLSSTSDAIIPLEEMERRYLQEIVQRYHGDNRSLSRQLGISERTLYRKLNQLKTK
jgi:transcriptional regulator with PAS, ATPase and Fis domain